MRENASSLKVQLSLYKVNDIAAQLPASHFSWLSEQELQRLRGLKSPSRRAQFLAAHWLARQTMANWLGGRWSDYYLSAPDDAAPIWLDGPATLTWQDVHVSLSHSGNWVSCALARHRIGVDVECSDRMRDFPALGSWIYPEFEMPAFEKLAPELQRQAFYVQWTLKEAWLKQAEPMPVKKLMQAIRFELGSGTLQAIVSRAEVLTLALYPARAATTCFVDPLLQTMNWSDWAYRPPR